MHRIFKNITVTVASCALFCGTIKLNASETTFQKSLTNKEIDILFVDFLRESELKALAKSKKKKTNKMSLEKKLNNITDLPVANNDFSSSRVILPHNANIHVGLDKKAKKTFILGGDKNSLDNAFFSSSAFTKSMIKGFLCNDGKCIILTDDGFLDVGDKLPTGEKIVRIKQNKVTTDSRTIEF